MSLSEVSMMKNIWQQTKWKLKAYSSAFVTVFIVQFVFAFFFIFLTAGTSSLSIGGSFIQMQVSIFTLDGLLMASVVSSFIVSILLANRGALHENASIVMTRTTATLSTALFLVILSAVATLTVVSSFSIALWLMQQTNDIPWLASTFFIPIKTYVVCFMLHVTATAVGLVGGTIFAKSKILFLLTLIAGTAIGQYIIFTTLISQSGSGEMVAEPVSYYFVSVVLGVLAIVFYSIAVWLRNRQEVA